MDITHHYTEKGEGEPLILLHGNGESGGYFKNQIDEFSKYYRVIAPDTRGHGKTPRGRAPFTIEQFATDLKDFMEASCIDRAHILGFSDGANIAMVFAIKYPEMADKLILDGGNLDPSGLENEVLAEIDSAHRAAIKSQNEREIEMLELMINDPHIPTSDLLKIRSKTLVIAGTEDMIKEDHTRLIASSIQNSELLFIEGDHFIAANNSACFNKAVNDFLKK